MKLRTRLILTTVGVALLLVLPALYAALQLRRLRDIASEVSTTHGTAYLAMGRFQARMSDLDRLSRAYVVIGDPLARARVDSVLNLANQHATSLGEAGYPDLSGVATAQLDSIGGVLQRIDGIIATDPELATDLLERAKPMFSNADNALERISGEIDRRRDEDLAQAARISAAALTTTLLALVACFFIAALFGAWGAEGMVRPIQRLRRAMAAVAAGEFVVPQTLPYERSDEIGDVSRSFRAMAQQLADLDRMKADFVSVATHELKTPINVVSGYAELIQEGVYGDVTEKQQTALTSIQEQARLMTYLVNQLLDISRLEAGGMRLEMDDMMVRDLFERVERTFEVLARRQDVGLVVNVAESVPRTVRADADRLRDQVLGNLLSNALKFTPAGGRIDVRAWSEDGSLMIEVRDTGEGMPADQLPHVFDKYFQIGEQARSKGAGLGLTIAHEIVAGHGGTITVESEPGVGTVFCIALPLGGVNTATGTAV